LYPEFDMGRGEGIIIADDEVLIAFHIQSILESAGFQIVDIAATAEQALAIAASMKPALAILDIGLPDLDGVELAKRLRAKHDVAILFVTGFGDAETRQRIEAVAGAGYLQKPLHPVELTTLVAKLLRSTATG
jgi:two-component system, response regulator PdtaR